MPTVGREDPAHSSDPVRAAGWGVSAQLGTVSKHPHCACFLSMGSEQTKGQGAEGFRVPTVEPTWHSGATRKWENQPSRIWETGVDRQAALLRPEGPSFRQTLPAAPTPCCPWIDFTPVSPPSLPAWLPRVLGPGSAWGNQARTAASGRPAGPSEEGVGCP